MFFIFGKHEWRPQTIGYRGDYCLSCNRETVSLKRQTLDFYHIYYVPLIPAGRSTHWHCIKCDEDPQKRTKVDPKLFLAVAILALLAGATIFLVTARNDDGGSILLSLSISAIFGLLWFFSNPGPSRQEELKHVGLFLPNNCLSCEEPLGEGQRTCPVCLTEYYDTPVE